MIPWASPALPLVRAMTRAWLALWMPVFQVFSPLRTHSSPSRSARVAVAPASDPPSGSVRPKAASALPAARSGSHCDFCSSVPNSAIGAAPNPTAASSVTAIEESTRANSSTAMQNVTKSASAPP